MSRVGQRNQRWLEGLESRLLLSEVSGNYLPAMQTWENTGGYVTAASNAPALQVASNFLMTHVQNMSLVAKLGGGWVVTDQYTDADTGETHIYFRERFNGLDIANADAAVQIAQDGRIISAYSRFVSPTMAPTMSGLLGGLTLSATSALSLAAGYLKLNATAGAINVVAAPSQTNAGVLASGVSKDPIPAKMEYVATPAGLQLAWDFIVRTQDGAHWYETAVGAKGGNALATYDWADSIASYDVYALPTENPNDGSRTIVSGIEDPTASPFGWQDTNGVAGADSTITSGNNVQAQDDTDGNNTGGFSPSGGASLTFDFPIDLTQAPSTYLSAAVTNLYYMNNVLHDIHYKYGFTEAAGNFQVNDYGRGGVGGDPVIADAQDGSSVNNADFFTPPDGSSPRMQMYLFDASNPDRDGDLDNSIIIHEYGHGVSTRLTGGPANSNSLDATQSGGMGEGWSDWWALMLTLRSTDVQNQAYPIGTYALGQSPTGSGIRRYPYSYNMAIDPLTLDAYGLTGTGGGVNRSIEVHNTGEIWCSALWDMTWLLINKYGFNANLYTGYTGAGSAGNILAMKLVMDALKLQPANPSFIDARDAILQADVALTGGANQNEIWQAFARRGMGASALAGGSANSTTVTPAYDLPWPDPVVISSTPSGSQVVPVSAVDLRFMKPMDTTSFNVAADVASFTGPGGNLKPTITGFSWTDTKTLHITFSAVSAMGSYAMTVGPNILSADNGHPMDQDKDGILGEATQDQYTATFAIASSVGPDGFGYSAAAYPYENVVLTPGDAGVTSILDSQDDASAMIPLGTNTFNFYGVTITGNSQLFASSNGRLTLYSTTTADWNNGDLTSDSMPVIAPLWDDWVTYDTSSGPANDVVLYQFDAANNRLIVEWSNVEPYGQPGTATFQAILQLNTGVNPGNITFNYVDTDVGSSLNDGVGATVGIKDNMTQGANRLAVSVSAASPWVGSGKAIRITQSNAITGTVFQDNDASGSRNTGDSTLGFRTVYLDANNNGIKDAGETSVLSDAMGVYSFAGLAAGTYTVRQVVGSGLAQTLPAAGGAYVITLLAGGVANGKDFGSASAGTITGTVYEDANLSLGRDAGENVLPGWTVYADVNNNGVLDAGDISTVSVAGGSYTLTGLAPGVSYAVRYQLQAGWVNSSPIAGTANVLAILGSPVAGPDFGVVQNGTLRIPDLTSSGAPGVDFNYYEFAGGISTVGGLDALTPAAILPAGWDSNFNIAARPAGHDDLFGFIWKAYVLVPSDGVYTFYLNSDEGSALWIGATQVVNNDGVHAAQEINGRIGLKAGLHAITVKYFENTGAQSLVVSYAAAGIPKQPIPNSALFLNPTFDGTAGTDDWIVQRNGTYEQVFANTPTSGVPARIFLAAGLPTLTFNGTGGNDSLSLDFSNGGPLGSLAFNGGANTDTVKVTGKTPTDAFAVTASAVTTGGTTVTLGGAEALSLKTGTFSLNGDLGGMDLTLDGTMTVGATENIGALTLAANAVMTIPSGTYRILRVKSVTLGTGAKLDLGNNGMIVDYTGGPSSGAAVETALNTLVGIGFNGGNWLGAGITSSAAAAGAGMALGVADNAALPTPRAVFGGQAAPATAVLIMYTYIDDIDLDGALTSNDAITFSAHYLEGAAGTHRTGDLNYNGVYDSNDAILFAADYNESLPPITPVASLWTSAPLPPPAPLVADPVSAKQAAVAAAAAPATAPVSKKAAVVPAVVVPPPTVAAPEKSVRKSVL